MRASLSLADRSRCWCLRALRWLYLRVGGNDPREWEFVLVAREDLPGYWIRERYEDEDLTAFHGLTGL